MNLLLRNLTVKALSLKQRVRVLADKTEGEWKTIRGRHVLVGKGETPLEALNKSLGKGKQSELVNSPAARQKASDAFYSKLSPAEKEQITNYTAGPDLSLSLRNDHAPTGGLKKQLAAMDQIFDKHSVSMPPGDVYRIIDPEYTKSLAVGSSFTDKAFVSTTASTQGLEAVLNGAKDSGMDTFNLRIQIPAGTKGLPLSGKWNQYFSDQDEVLLKRGSFFKVVSKDANSAVLRLVS